MTADESLAVYGLVPLDEALTAIRAMLAREAEIGAGQAGEPEDDLALLCCVQLFSRGLLEDVLRIWDAKSCGDMDLGTRLDVQLLCGAGLERTKAFLQQQPSAQARDALRYIVKCQEAGNFQGFDPARYLDFYRSYFREP